MLDTVIVGGGLCGLALASSLHGQGREFALYEARNRLGGRILSVPGASGMALDLGPAWFWPDTQPRMARLVEELGLASFPQHDSGAVLSLADHDKKPETLATDSVHGGARRLEGGMASLVRALAERLPGDALHPEHVLGAVRDRGDHVELHFAHGEVTVIVRARHVVLALPPRLLAERVRFEPALDEPTREAMRATPTWMADQAKVLVAYDRAFWREAGQSGNAFVSHEHVALGEIFDACNADGDQAALGGFFALPPPFRAAIDSGSVAMLVSSQLVQVFGQDAEGGEQHVQDWAAEPYTCASLDLTPPGGHPEYGNPGLRRRLWNDKLHFGGSETAGYGGGYLEGALDAAARLLRTLVSGHSPVIQAASPNPAAGVSPDDPCLAHFSDWVAAQRASAFGRYRSQLNHDLAAQQREQLTQRALLGAVEQVYSAALDQLDGLPFDAADVAIRNGRSDLTPRVLAPFDGFNKALLDEAVAFNRTSCALSNFTYEHEPDSAYVDTILRDLAAAWREFALGVNAVLVARTQASARTADAVGAVAA